MAGFLYFIPDFHVRPDQSRPSDAELRRRGLDHLVGAMLTSAAISHGGPGECSGVLLAVDEASLMRGGRRVERIIYLPARQTWRVWPDAEHVKQSGFWIGFETADRPRPMDLARRDAPHGGQGYPVPMANGDAYHIPPQRFFPDTFEMTAGGVVARVTKKEFLPMKAAAEKLYQMFYETAAILAEADGDENATPGLDDTEMFVVGTQFLSLLYRVGVAEATVLGLWDDDSLGLAMKAIIDMPSFEKMIQQANKKKKSIPDC